MSTQADEKALQLLEKAVLKAQNSLEKTKHFQPFLLLLTDTGKIEEYENDIEDATQSYEKLELLLSERIVQNDIDIMILAVDTRIPSQVSKGIPHGIRLHLEERSQKEHKIGARFLYVPYELCSSPQESLYIKLHLPLPVGFPAAYIL